MGLLLVGHAASLRLINAGTALHYQHYFPWPEIVTRHPLAAAVVGGQMTIVAVALLMNHRGVLDWFRRSIGWVRGALLVVAVVLSSATLSADAGVYARELIIATLIQISALATICFAVASLPRDVVERLSRAGEQILGGTDIAGSEDPAYIRPVVDRFVLSCAITAAAIAALLCLFIYERHPHVQDEVAYLYQARYFAEGLLAMRAPAVPEAFELFLFDVSPRGWYSVFAPGWPLTLAVGQLIGALWLINPILTGVNAVLAYLVVWHLYGRRAAKLTVLLLSASPWFLYLGMSFMPHQVSLTCLLVGVLAIIRARNTGASWPGWIAGGAVGFLSLVRQLDGFVVALLLGLWAIGVGGSRLRIGAITGLVLGAALIGGLTLPYNRFFTDDPLKFPMMAYFDHRFGVNTHAYGFGPERGMGWGIDPFPGHGPVDAVVNANLNTTAINVELFGWPSGSLVLVFMFAVLATAGGSVRQRPRDLLTADWMAIALVFAIFGAYFFNYFSGGPDFGARYWFLMIGPCVVLSVRGLEMLASTLHGPPGHAIARVTTGAIALSCVALVTFVPWRALDKYHQYLGMRPEVRLLAREHDFGRSIVFIRGAQFPDYASAAIYNPLDVQADDPVYVHDRNPAIRQRLREVYPDRSIWVVDGPSRTGAGYRVVAGPTGWSAFLERNESR